MVDFLSIREQQQKRETLPLRLETGGRQVDFLSMRSPQRETSLSVPESSTGEVDFLNMFMPIKAGAPKVPKTIPERLPKQAHQEVNVKEYIAGLNEDVLLQDARQKATWTRNFLGEGIANFLYGEEVMSKLPPEGQALPNEYKHAIYHKGEWFTPEGKSLPPPPKEFMESMAPRAFPGKAYEFMLPEGLHNLSDKLMTLMQGGQADKAKVVDDILSGGFESAMYYGPIGVQNFKVLMSLLKGMAKVGFYPPRMIFKAINKVLPANAKPLPILEGVWERIIVPKGDLKALGSEGMEAVQQWWTKYSPLTGKHIPTYEGKKSLVEIFQPAVERLERAGLDQPFRETVAKKAIVTKIGDKFQAQINKLTPSESVELMRRFRGHATKSEKVNNIYREWSRQNRRATLGSGYHQPFIKAMESTLQKGIGPKGQRSHFGPEDWDNLDYPGVAKFFKGLDDIVNEKTGKAWFGGIHRQAKKVLDEAIRDPLVPDNVKVIARDAYSLASSTSMAVAEASKSASKKLLISELKKSNAIKATLDAGDLKADWLVSKHPDLKGAWARRDVELELRALDQIPKLAHKTFNKWFLTPWKTSKVILRPATWMRNVLSNTVLNDMGGLPFYRVDIYQKALKQMRQGGEHWRDWQKLTGGGGTFSMNEIVQLQEGMRYGANMWDKGLTLFDRMASVPREYYGLSEQWAKLAKFIWNRQHGMVGKEAAWDAMKWTFNYGEITRATGFIRSNLAPFFTWQSKVLPLMAETAIKHPLRLGKWMLFYQGLQELGINSVGITDSEWDYVNSILPEYIQEGQFLLMPWRDTKDRLQLLNLTYMMPGFGDLAELNSNPMGWILGNPLLTVSGSLLTNTKWSGAPLTYDWEEPSVKFMKKAAYVWEQMMPIPSFAPGGVDWNQMMRTIRDDPNALTWEQMMSSSAGFKQVPIDVGRQAKRKRVVEAIHRQEMGSEFKKEMQRAKTPEKKRRVAERFQRLREGLVD